MRNPAFDEWFDWWSVVDQNNKLDYHVANGTLEFYRKAGGEAPTIFQVGNWSTPAGMRVAAIFELGNTSSKRQRVTIQIQGHDDSAMTVCSFRVPPGSLTAVCDAPARR